MIRTVSQACLMTILAMAVMPLSRAAPSSPSPAESERTSTPPAVWIFAGLPGDRPRHGQYLATVGRLADVFRNGFGVGNEDITILFGDGSESPYRACSAESVEHEFGLIRERARGGRPTWLFLLGHSNSTPDSVHFNLAGPDMSAVDLAKGLGDLPARPATVVFLTTSAGGKYLPFLARRGRILIAATEAEAEDNETEFPHVLPDVLEDAAADADNDGFLSVLEIFRATRAAVLERYASQGFVVTERAVLDGNGDGVGTAQPAADDAVPAARVGLTRTM